MQKSKRQYKNLDNPSDIVINKIAESREFKNDNNVIGITKLGDQKLIGCANR